MATGTLTRPERCTDSESPDARGFMQLCEKLHGQVDFDTAILLSRDHQRDVLCPQEVYSENAWSGRLRSVAVDGAVREMMDGRLCGAVCLDTSRSCCSLERQMSRLGMRSTLCVPVQLDSAEVLLCLASHRLEAFACSAPAIMARLQTC